MGESVTNVFVGIPVLNRLDLLRQCLDAIDVAAQILIINNNSIDPGFKKELDELARLRNLRVLHQARNLGVAASWNLIMRTAFSEGHQAVLIGSNDTCLHPRSLDAVLKMPKDNEVSIWCLHGFNFFLITRATVERAGWFDENFYPAYKEDQDYVYRCRLAGLRQVDVPGAAADHVGSATIRSNADYAAQCRNTHFNWNLNHYLMKWGGDAGQEKFTHPYNDPAHDLKWWPDPSETIDIRDWDNIYRNHSTRKLYNRAASTPSDIWEHVPLLYRYGATVRHITEFGSGCGNSTCAFLFARPDKLISYDLVKHPAIQALEKAALAESLQFRFCEMDVRALPDIEETDLLFIDTRHTYEHMKSELRFAARVRRYIVAHDTETFGIDPEPQAGVREGPGIWQAMAEFLRDNAEWEINALYRNNNGLTVLRRR